MKGTYNVTIYEKTNFGDFATGYTREISYSQCKIYAPI
jgi:hypothetical protein